MSKGTGRTTARGARRTTGLARIAARNVLRNGRRSILSILAVAVAALAITLVFSILEGMKEDMTRNEQNYYTGEVRIRHRDFDRYEHLQPVHYVVSDYSSLMEELRELPEFGTASPRITVPAVAFRGERRIVARGLGVDMALEREFMDLDAVVAAGRLPEPGTSEALVGVGLAERLGVDIGDTATFLTQTRRRASNAFTVDVVGIAGFAAGGLDRNTFLLPLEAAARYMRMGDAVSTILLKSGGGESRALAESVDALLARRGRGEVSAAHWTDVSEGYAYVQFADFAYNFMALFFFALGATVVVNTTMMTVHERTHEIGTLAALGMRPREITRLFFTEAAYLGFAGSLAGVLLGIGLVIPLQSIGIDFGSTTEMMEGITISSVLYPVLNVRSTVGTFVFSFAVAALAGYIPARRAAKLKPVDALRE